MFSNTQSVNASTSIQFYRNSGETESVAEVEKQRVWFNFNDTNTSCNQMLLGYMQGATNVFDNMIDGNVLDDTKPKQANQALLVKTTLTNGQSITKKIVF